MQQLSSKYNVLTQKLEAELLHAAATQSVVTPLQVSQLILEQRRIREAFVEALKPGGAVASVLTAEICRQLPDTNATAAYIAVNQMLYRRAKEQAEWHRVLTYDQQFHSDITAKLHAPAPLADAPSAPLLTPQDHAKLVESLLQSKRESGPEPVIHILAAADGQRRWHDALAVAWQPGGAVHGRLMSDMRLLLPDVPERHVEGAVARYLDARYDRAVTIAGAMEVESPVVQQAMVQSLAADVPTPSPGGVSVSGMIAQFAQSFWNALPV